LDFFKEAAQEGKEKEFIQFVKSKFSIPIERTPIVLAN
jgi:hypothetical protein